MASEYIKYQLKDVKPAEKPPEHTPKEKFLNWLYYHKIHLIIGAVVIGILLDLGFHTISQKKHAPDYQIAYAGSAVLPEETVAALTDAFSALGTDVSGDGQVLVSLHSYMINTGNDTSAETAEYAAASEIQLISDMERCDSYFFLVEDPEQFQMDFQILADEDGSLKDPEDTALSEGSGAGSDASDADSSGSPIARYYAVPLSECEALSGVMEAVYSEVISGETASGNNSDFLDGLYLARRGFAPGRECEHKDACDLLWEKLTGQAD